MAPAPPERGPDPDPEPVEDWSPVDRILFECLETGGAEVQRVVPPEHPLGAPRVDDPAADPAREGLQAGDVAGLDDAGPDEDPERAQ